MRKIKYFTLLLFIFANIETQDINNGDKNNPISQQNTLHQEQNLGYFAQTKQKIMNFLSSSYNWYDKYRNVINPVLQSIAAVVVTNLLYDKMEQVVTNGYRMMRAKEGEALLRGPKNAGGGYGLYRSLDHNENVFRYPTLEEVNKRYNINMSPELYDSWIKYMQEVYKPITNIEEGWKW